MKRLALLSVVVLVAAVPGKTYAEEPVYFADARINPKRLYPQIQC